MSDLDQSLKRTVLYGSDRTQPLSLSADEGRALDVSGAAREICVLQFSAVLITIFVYFLASRYKVLVCRTLFRMLST